MIAVPPEIKTEDVLRRWVLAQGIGWWQFQREREAERAMEWNAALHPRNPVGSDRGGEFITKWARPPGAWKSRYQTLGGTFFGWDSPVVYVDDSPILMKQDEWFDNGSRRKGVLWKGTWLPDGKFFMWFPGNYGPHHAEVEQKYMDDHPDLDPYEPYFEDGVRVSGVGIPRDWREVAVIGPSEQEDDPAFYEDIMRRVQRQRKDFEFAESLAKSYDEREGWIHPRDYEFDPHQPRDRYGRWTRTGASVIAPWKEIIGKKLSFSASEVTMDNLTEDEQGRIRATWEKQTGVPAASVAANVRDVFRSAEGTPEWEGGLTWYEDAHEFARQRAETHDLSIETMAAVVSALSPMTEWNTNKHQADLMVQFYSRDPEHFKSLLPQQAAHEVLAWAKERGEKWPLGAGRRNIVNAARLLQGATPEEVLPQAKTRGFYNSIVEPNNPWDVVVDSHMINVAYGGMTPGAQGLLIEVSKPGSADVWGDIVTPEGAEYTARPPFSWFGSPKVRGRDVGVIPIIADAVRAAAAEWNQEHPDQQLSPMQVQAITWVQWLKLHPAQEKRKAVKESQRATLAALRLAEEVT